MAQVNKYANRYGYAADKNRKATRSAVSYVVDDGALIYDGVNVVVGRDAAGVGDLAVFDKALGEIRFVKGSTLDYALLPAALVPLAVVYARSGERLRAVSLDNATDNGSTSICWAASYEVALSGFNLAAGGTFTLNINGIDYPFTYPAGASLPDIAALVNRHATITQTYGWAASTGTDAVILSCNTNVEAYAAIRAVAGCVLTRTADDRNYQTSLTGVLPVGGSASIRRNNYVDSSLAGCNTAKFLQYYSVNGSIETGVAPGSATIIRESAFTQAANPALTAAYSTYEAYLYGEHLLQYPGAFGSLLCNGKENTGLIGSMRFVDIRGKSAPCYPAAAAALDYGVSVAGYTTGFEAGAWWLPSVEEMFLLMRDRVLGAADLERDPVNRTLARLGKASCYGADFYMWTSCEYVRINSLRYNSTEGSINIGSKYGKNSVRPVSEL